MEIEETPSTPINSLLVARSVGQIYRYGLETREIVSEIPFPSSTPIRIRRIPGFALRFAASSARGTDGVLIFDGVSGKELFRLAGVHTRAVWGLGTLPGLDSVTSARIVSGDWGGGHCVVWNAETGAEVNKLDSSPMSVFSIKYSPLSRQFCVAGAQPYDVFVCDAFRCRVVSRISGHSGFVLGLDIDPRSGTIFTSANDQTLKWFSPNAKAAVGSTSLPKPGKTLFFDSETGLVYCGMLGDISIWDPRKMTDALCEFSPSTSNIYAIEKIGPNQFANVSIDGQVRFWSGGRGGGVGDKKIETLARLRGYYGLCRLPGLLDIQDDAVEREYCSERLDFLLRFGYSTGMCSLSFWNHSISVPFYLLRE